jgi:hypothetical protein
LSRFFRSVNISDEIYLGPCQTALERASDARRQWRG